MEITNGNCFLVVGATHEREAAMIRAAVGDEIDFLAPGYGKQAAKVRAAIMASRNSAGAGFIANSSSGIVHASSGSDCAEKAREALIRLSDELNEYRFA